MKACLTGLCLPPHGASEGGAGALARDTAECSVASADAGTSIVTKGLCWLPALPCLIPLSLATPGVLPPSKVLAESLVSSSVL